MDALSQTDPLVRELTTHRTPGNQINEDVRVAVVDAPGAGGASHCYQITPAEGPVCTINFQNGTVEQTGVNGVTQEALLAVVLDRLQSFQKGPFGCIENATALLYVVNALDALHARTQNRVRRGVEGKLEK